MKLFLPLFLFLSIHLSGQVIYDKTESPDLDVANWDWINPENGRKNLTGKHLVLEFWASWCKSCLAAVPHLNELNTEFSEDIAFVSVNSYDTQSLAEKVIKKHKMNSYVVMDQDKYLKNLFEVQLIPVTILVDKNGVLRWKGLANQLTSELLEGFIRTDTIHSVIDTKLVDQTFMIKDITQNKQIPVQLKTTRLIRDQFQVSATSLDLKFDSIPLIDMKNWTIPGTIQTLLNTEKEEKVAVTFSGDVPDNYSIDFLATANQKIEEKLFLSETINAFAKALNVSIDTSRVQQHLQTLRVNSDDLIPFLSTDQKADVVAEDQENQYVFQNLTLKELAGITGQLTNTEIIFEGDDQQKYNFTIDKSINFSEMKIFLKNKFNIVFQEKEVERDQYEFTFN